MLVLISTASALLRLNGIYTIGCSVFPAGPMACLSLVLLMGSLNSFTRPKNHYPPIQDRRDRGMIIASFNIWPTNLRRVGARPELISAATVRRDTPKLPSANLSIDFMGSFRLSRAAPAAASMKLFAKR